VLKSKKVRSVRKECRKVRSSTESYVSGRRCGVVCWSAGVRKGAQGDERVRTDTIAYEAYGNTRTRTLTSDSIEKTENDATTTRANDE
jgi:hypothetical protein